MVVGGYTRSQKWGYVRIIAGTLLGGALGFYVMHRLELSYKEVVKERLRKYEIELKNKERLESEFIDPSLDSSDPAKLKARKIVFEEIYITPDPGTLEQLKELSSRRRLIEEATNETSSITKAIAKEMSGGLTSRHEQDLQKLEQYLPRLENFMAHVHLVKDTSKIAIWTSNLRIRWSSALSASPIVKIMGPKFFRIDDLQFELGMTLFLYGAILRQRASEVLSTDLVASATHYRKAAGVYDYLAHMVLPLLHPALGQERPPEVVSSISSIMSLICLAEAQAVTLRKAEEKGSSEGLLSKLHYGIKELLDEACSILEFSTGGCKNISQRFQEFIYSCRSLHELRSQRHFAESLKVDGQIGLAIGVVRYALHKVKKKIPGEGKWRLVFKKEMEIVGELLRKLEHENNFVCYEKIPSPDELPIFEGKKLVSSLPYQPQRWEKKLVFKTED